MALVLAMDIVAAQASARVTKAGVVPTANFQSVMGSYQQGKHVIGMAPVLRTTLANVIKVGVDSGAPSLYVMGYSRVRMHAMDTVHASIPTNASVMQDGMVTFAL
jgi:hypothetical protein